MRSGIHRQRWKFGLDARGGRCEIDLIPLAAAVDQAVRHMERPLKVAVMGCVVNGPGEAREADVGIAGGRGFGLLFRSGEIIKKVPAADMLSELLQEINKSTNNK